MPNAPTMKAALLDGPNAPFRLAEVARPAVPAGHVLVQVHDGARGGGQARAPCDGRSFGLGDVAAAHEAITGKSAVGKIVVSVV
jgi:NADPH:quinone reductase-like Zn-dependent oxidoreductase